MTLMRKTLVDSGYDFMYSSGVFRGISKLFPDTLTVLMYHRINNPDHDGFQMFKPNVSATPEQFNAQLDYLAQHYSVISLGILHDWLFKDRPLPSRAVLITFDDGYEDNYRYAMPALQKRGFPAVIFLATDYIGQSRPFYWDFVAYCFGQTPLRELNLPLLGLTTWSDDATRDQVAHRWVEAVKHLPDRDRHSQVERLPGLLQVTIPSDAFAGLHLDWDQVRVMLAAGIEFGSHTSSHPILTRIPLHEAEEQIARSKRVLEESIGRKVVSFAYPNGHAANFSTEVTQMVKNLGMDLAFSLLPGPTLYSTVRRNPLAIRRIAVTRRDTLPRFAARLSGVSRVLNK